MFKSPLTAATHSLSLAQALSYCQEITQQHSKTFYLGSRFFPPNERKAVWAVYAACRLADNIVDESTGGQATEGLKTWWDDIKAVYNGQPRNDPMTIALAWAVQQYPIPLPAFAELHEGLKMDLEGYEYHTMDDLILYCRRVAGVVGFMIAPISGYSGGEQTLHHALMLGQAMQLTNILRDVGEDLNRGRIYLPQQLMAQFGVSRQTLEQGIVTPEYRALMQYLCAITRQKYTQGRQGIPALGGNSRLAVAAAARAYEGILDDLVRNDFNNFQRRAFVSGPRKLLMLPQAWSDIRKTGPAY